MRNGVVAVVLLKNLQRASGGIAEDYRIWFEMCGDSRVLHPVDSRLQVERETLAGDEEILVVDG